MRNKERGKDVVTGVCALALLDVCRDEAARFLTEKDGAWLAVLGACEAYLCARPSKTSSRDRAKASLMRMPVS